MSILPILTWPDPRLGAACAPAGGAAGIEALAADMLETMYAAPGRGLAGPQVGAMLRIFVMDAGWKDGAPAPMVCIDPEVEALGDDVASNDEGCLSIPGVSAEVTRPARVRMRWTDLDGTRREGEFEGFEAVCIQHEADHLDGILTLDRIGPSERARVLEAYAGAST